MAENWILMSTAMVTATLADRKNQTRRVVKPVPGDHPDDEGYLQNIIDRARYSVGDLLYIRETIKLDHYNLEAEFLASDSPFVSDRLGLYAKLSVYARSSGPRAAKNFLKKKSIPSIHMPKVTARLWVEVTGVRAEWLQDISEKDAKAEGFERGLIPCPDGFVYTTYSTEFEKGWNSLNEKRGFGWPVNPYVWVYDFKVVDHGKN